MNWIIKATLAVIIVGMLSQTGGTPVWPRWAELTAQVCVERPGDNGWLNIWPADVIIERGVTLRLPGESAACAFVAAGKHSIWVESKDPYDRESAKPATWKSEVLAVTVRPKERLEFEVCGTGQPGYSTWKIQPPNSKTPCVPKG
jgi:hypothetical protein